MAGRKPSSYTTALRVMQVELSKLQDEREAIASRVADVRNKIAVHKQQKIKRGQK